MGEVRCPNCGFANPAGFKFCGDCGARMIAESSGRPGAPPQAGPSTSQEQGGPAVAGRPAGGGTKPLLRKIGGSPGQPPAAGLEDAPAPAGAVLTASSLPADVSAVRGERRNITVLFADLSDYTAISSRLDPEEVFNIVNRCLKAMADQVNLLEGTVDKFTGDGVMAVFGAPKAHENNAERALLAALGMMEAVEELNEELSGMLGGRRLQIHVGVNSGVAVAAALGNSTFQQYTTIGDTVNVAARLGTAAQAGQIFVGDEVYRVAEPLFEFTQLPPVRVKGKDEPLAVYQLTGLRERRESVRGLPGLRAPMVGREKELYTLLTLSRRWLEEKQGQVVIVGGDAGIGKSRLTAEWRRHVEKHPQQSRVLEGACLSYTHNSPFWPILDLLRGYLEISPADDVYVVGAKVEARLRRLLPEQYGEVAPYVKHLLAVDVEDAGGTSSLSYLQPAELRNRITQALRTLFAAEARRQPLALVFDDLHWADEASLDVIISLYETAAATPLLLYLIARPARGGDENRLASEAGRQAPNRLAELRLDPLSAGDSSRLLQLLQLPELPGDLLEAITERAEGNPFFLEEMIRMLIHQQVLRQRDGRLELNPGAEVRYLSVPQNLQDLIMARYDRMSESLKQTLATAAVIGRSFYFAPLRRVLGGVSAAELRRRLRELDEFSFVRLRDSQREPEYTFVHTITRETIYNSLLRRTREELHGQIGEALEEQYAGRLDEYAEVLAYHFGSSRMHGKAVDYLVWAGKKAAARYANEEARSHFVEARATLAKMGAASERSPHDLAIHGGMGDLLVFAGKYEEAHAEYQGGLAIAERIEATGDEASILRRMAVTHRMRGEIEEALSDLQAAIDTLDRAGQSGRGLRHGEREAAAAVYDELGWLHFQQGEIEEAESNLRQALSFVQGSKAYGVLASIYGHLGGVSFRRAAWAEAERYVTESLGLQEILDDPVGQARCYINLGAVNKLQGAWDRAIHYYSLAIATLTKLNHRELLARVHGNLGTLLCDRGDLPAAERHLNISLDIAGLLNNPYQMVLSLKNMGYYHLAAQQWEQSVTYLERGLKLTEEMGAPELTSDIYAALGEAYLRRGNLAAALEQATNALGAARAESVESEEYARALRLAGTVRQALGEHAEARRLLEQSIAILEQLRNDYELARSCYELGLLLAGSTEDGAEGRAYLARALELFAHLPAPPDADRAQQALAAA